LLRSCLIIFLAAFAVRFSGTLRHSPAPDNIYESTKVALTLAKHGAFADPFIFPTGPTAHVAPGYPLVLSLVYRCFGAGTAAEIAKRVLTCAVSSLQYACLPPLALLLGLSRRVGFSAAIFGALVPLQRYAESASSWESPWAAVLLMLLTAMLLQGCGTGYLAACRFGVAWGIALLFAPALASIYAGFLWLLRRKARTIAISFLTTVLCLLPWAYRNERRLGSWIWLRDNFGLELSISNQDGANARMGSNLPDYSHPHGSFVEASRVEALGEVEYNRRKLREALDWIRNNPGHFVRLTAARVFYFWFPWASSGWDRIFLALVTIASFFGLYETVRVNAVSARLVTIIWLLYPLVFYVIEFDRRYRHPIEWTMLLMAARGAGDLVTCLRASFTNPKIQR